MSAKATNTKKITNLDSILNTNFPVEAQLQLILPRVFDQLFNHLILTTPVTPRLTYVTLMLPYTRKFGISLNFSLALAI